MSLQVVLEVTQPYHASGRDVLYSPGEQFPLGTDLPPDVRVVPVVADVPDAPAKQEPKPAAAVTAKAAVAAKGKT